MTMATPQQRIYRAWFALLGAIGLTFLFASALGAKATIQPTTEDQQLLRTDGQEDDFFGRSVAIDGNTMVVGASGAADQQGTAYVFERDDLTLTPSSPLWCCAALCQ